MTVREASEIRMRGSEPYVRLYKIIIFVSPNGKPARGTALVSM